MNQLRQIYYSGEQLGDYHQKKGKVKLPLFFGYGEREITIYAVRENCILAYHFSGTTKKTRSRYSCQDMYV